MAISRAMRRLFRVLYLEEEQRRRALESAQHELIRLEQAMAAAASRDQKGRQAIAASARTGEFIDRIAGIEESRAAARMTAILEPRIAEAQRNAAQQREAFLAKRIERRQAGTLIQQSVDHAAIDAGRRSQQQIDDWHLQRLRRQGTGNSEKT